MGRHSCFDCTRKHLEQAEVLAEKALENGFNLHAYWKAIGHLSEASDEILGYSIKLANLIRDRRLDYMADPLFQVPYGELVGYVSVAEDRHLDGESPVEDDGVHYAEIVDDVNPVQKALEHIAKATILVNESFMGYPNHMTLAQGNVVRASTLLHEFYPKISQDMAEYAKTMNGNKVVNLMDFIDAICEQSENKGSEVEFEGTEM